MTSAPDWAIDDECPDGDWSMHSQGPGKVWKVSALTEFLQQNDSRLINKKKNADKTPSHVFMDAGISAKTFAGKMQIESNALTALREACIKDFENDTLHPLVERFPEVYRFAVDFDLKTQTELSKSDKFSFARTAQKALTDFLNEAAVEESRPFDSVQKSEALHRSIVCTVEGDARMCNQLFKDGIHQHWPDLHVNHTQAKHLLSKVILPAMETTHSDAGINWAQTLDTSIYHEGKGLRPCYSIKREICSPCMKRSNTSCTDCGGNKVKHGTDHFYVPTLALNPDGSKDTALTLELEDDMLAALTHTSVIPTGTPSVSCEFECAPIDNLKRKATTPDSVKSKKQKQRQLLTTAEVLQMYHAAGGTLQLQELESSREGYASWREISPGHDGRRCLCPDCKGAMHSDNALLTDTPAGLLYTCLSTKNRHFLKQIVTDAQLCLGGDLGLAKLVARELKQDLFNASGDGNKAEFYLYNSRSCLWEQTYASTVKAEAIPRIRPTVVALAEAAGVNLAEVTTQLLQKKALLKKADGPRKTVLQKEVDKLKEDVKAALTVENLYQQVLKTLTSNQGLSNILQLLQCEVRDLKFKEKLDQRLDIISVTAGIIELRTGTLRPRTKQDYCSFAIDTEYNPAHPQLPKIREIMTQITLAERLNRPDYLEHMQRLLGYYITGETFLEIAAFCIGSGSNSKSFIAHLFQQCLGNYYIPASVYVLSKAAQGGSANATSSHMMALEGKRTAVVEELTDADIDIDQYKRILGGGKFTGRRNHQDQSEFTMTAKIMAFMNQLPKMKVDKAVKRRTKILPFDAKFYAMNDPDTAIRYDADDLTHFVRDDTLKKDTSLPPAFFAFCVEGAVKFYKHGLGDTPECCDVLKRELNASNDKVLTWIQNFCDTEDPDGMYVAAEAYANYRLRLQTSEVLGKQAFYADMQDKGYRRDKYQGSDYQFKNKYCFYGIKDDTK